MLPTEPRHSVLAEPFLDPPHRVVGELMHRSDEGAVVGR